jgi:hypothetical protein
MQRTCKDEKFLLKDRAESIARPGVVAGGKNRRRPRIFPPTFAIGGGMNDV